MLQLVIGAMGAIGLFALGPAEARGRIAVAWYDEATVPLDVQQRVATALAEAVGQRPQDVLSQPIDRARRVAAHGLTADRVDAFAQRSVRLDDAEALYRAARLSEAQLLVDSVLDGVRIDPLPPGSVRIAVRAHLLRAQIAWTRGDDAATDAALRAAIALDPDASVSTRRVPPQIAEVYARIQREILDGRAQWAPIRVEGSSTARVEIDEGPPGPVPPGEHFVVVRAPGRGSWAGVARSGGSVQVPALSERVSANWPTRAKAAETLCDLLDLRTLVLARTEDRRVALQGYECGEGFGPVFHETDEGLEPGAALVLGITPWSSVRQIASLQTLRWPEPRARIDRTREDEPATAKKKPWYQRAWVWVLVSGVIVAGVTTGAVLGTRDPGRRVVVDSDEFLGRD